MGKINTITTEMMEVCCDKICRFPYTLNEAELEDQCNACLLAPYVRDLMNLEAKTEDDLK